MQIERLCRCENNKNNDSYLGRYLKFMSFRNSSKIQKDIYKQFKGTTTTRKGLKDFLVKKKNKQSKNQFEFCIHTLSRRLRYT